MKKRLSSLFILLFFTFLPRTVPVVFLSYIFMSIFFLDYIQETDKRIKLKRKLIPRDFLVGFSTAVILSLVFYSIQVLFYGSPVSGMTLPAFIGGAVILFLITATETLYFLEFIYPQFEKEGLLYLPIIFGFYRRNFFVFKDPFFNFFSSALLFFVSTYYYKETKRLPLSFFTLAFTEIILFLLVG